jgi:hypothetical protein
MVSFNPLCCDNVMVKEERGCADSYLLLIPHIGPIARISPTSLLTSNPDLWLRVNTKPGYNRARWYFEACRLEYQKDNVFTMWDDKRHDERRKKLAPGVSLS